LWRRSLNIRFKLSTQTADSADFREPRFVPPLFCCIIDIFYQEAINILDYLNAKKFFGERGEGSIKLNIKQAFGGFDSNNYCSDKMDSSRINSRGYNSFSALVFTI
jgi:hypothetical protein